MKFKMTFVCKGDKTKQEMDETCDQAYAVDQESAEKAAQDVIDRFNNTLRPGESERSVVRVKFVGGYAGHDWRKSNLVTKQDSYGGMYDEYTCARCKVTSRRYGLTRTLVRDAKYKSQKYDSCEWKLKKKDPKPKKPVKPLLVKPIQKKMTGRKKVRRRKQARELT